MGSHTRFMLSLAGAALFVGGTALAAAAPPQFSASTGLARTRLRDFHCQRALDPGARNVTVTAVMRPLPGTRKLQVKFGLLRRIRRGRPFRLVRGPGLGTWTSPANPTLGQRPGDVWIVNHPVYDLAGPATYRFRVSFRWIGAGGHVLGTVSRPSPNCYEPELRPDLAVRSITPAPIAGSTTRERFVVAIHNRGKTGAGPFEVQLTDGQSAQAVTVASLASGATIRKGFRGPVCRAGGTVTAVADPTNMVDDFNRSNNRLTLTCSASAARTGAASRRAAGATRR